jgi:hypothetical protein
MSLAAIEAKLKPKVLETFDNVADSYKRLRRLEDQFELCRLNNRSSPTPRRGRDIFNHVEKSAELPQGASRLRPACA